MRKLTEQERDSLNNAHYQGGDDLYKRGKYAEALTLFKKALKAWPTDPDSAWAVADCYSELRKPGLAEKYYRLALDKCPVKKKSYLLYNIGNALFDQMKYKEALTYYDRIPKLNQIYKKARKNIRVAMSNIGRY
jgi:tetratricopeptide (TPR) repeat protein